MRVSTFSFSLLFVVSLVVLQGTAWGAVAGQIQFVAGDVGIIDASGSFRSAVKGGEVHAGETIVTGARGSAQVRMIDNGFLSIRPGSQLKIDEYKYEGKKSDTSFFSLLKGNFRALTGMIAKYNRKSWKTRTATAVLGVRGSDADIGFEPASQLTAIRTYTGGYTLTPRDGSLPPLDVDAGGIGVFSPGAPPRMAASFPFAPPAPRPEPGAAPSPRDDGTPPQDPDAPPPPATHVSGAAPEPLPADGGIDGSGTVQTLSDLPPLPEQFTIASGTTVLSSAGSAGVGIKAAPVGSGGVGAYMYQTSIVGGPTYAMPSSGSMVVDGSAQKTATLGPNGELLAITDVNIDGSFRFDANTATLLQSKTATIPSLGGTAGYTVSWGVWSTGYTVVDFGAPQTTVGNFYYGYTDRVTTVTEIAALAGQTFRYVMIGGAAGNETGAQASTFNVNVTGSFAAGPTLGTVTVGGSATFAQGSTGWQFSGQGNIADLINSNVGVLMGATCSTCNTSSAVADGQFVGTKAEGLILSVHATDGVGQGMVGTAALKR